MTENSEEAIVAEVMLKVDIEAEVMENLEEDIEAEVMLKAVTEAGVKDSEAASEVVTTKEDPEVDITGLLEMKTENQEEDSTLNKELEVASEVEIMLLQAEVNIPLKKGPQLL